MSPYIAYAILTLLVLASHIILLRAVARERWKRSQDLARTMQLSRRLENLEKDVALVRNKTRNL